MFNIYNCTSKKSKKNGAVAGIVLVIRVKSLAWVEMTSQC